MNVLAVRSEVRAELERRWAPKARVQVHAGVRRFVLLPVDVLLEFLVAEATLQVPFQQMLHADVRAQRGLRRALLLAVAARDVLLHLLVPVEVLLHAVLVLDVMSAEAALDLAGAGGVRVLDVILQAMTGH